MNKLIFLNSLNLKTKITGVVLLLFLCSIWVLTFLISRRLEQAMTAQLEAQQFSIASYIADSIEGQIKLRINSLTAIANIITPELIANPGKLREFLRDKPLLTILFQTGCVVISREGVEIADYPPLPGRAGALLLELEYFKDVVATVKPAVGKPKIGRFSKKPVIGFAVPVLSPSGKLIAVLAGYTLLSDPALLGSIETLSYKNFHDRLTLVSPRYRMIITGTDPARIMTPTPEPGVSPLHDQFMAGFEGSGIYVNSRGIRMFSSGKQIPTPGWFIRVGLPTEIAFAPIRSMKNRAYSMALVLSLISSLLVWLVIRQALRPLSTASKLIKDITEERLPPQDIPVTQSDEVGQLLSSFNVHLNYRKKAEDALRESEQSFHILFEQAGVGVAQVRTDTGEFLRVNEKFCDIVGYSREEMERLDFQSITHPDDLARDLSNIAMLKAGEIREYTVEKRYFRKDGWIVWVNLTVSPMWLPGEPPTVHIAVVEDITDRKRAEDKLRKSERQLLESQRVAHLGNWDLNLISRELEWSDESYRLFDKSPEVFVPSFNKFAGMVHPDDHATMETNFVKALESDANPYHVAVRIINNSGREWVMEAFGVVRRDSSGKALSIFGTAQDITERMKVEELIKRSLREKEALLKEIHHRVKNNMAVVSSLLSLQAEKVEDNTVRSLFEESQQRVKSMALVHEKLYQTKNLSSINFEDYIKSIVSEIISLYRIDTGAITTEINIEGVELELESAVPCGLIINELLTNAFKYAFPDKMRGVLSVHFRKTEDTYTLSIKDNGVGLPKGFDYKAGRTLGLRIVGVLTKQLKGTLQIKSDKGTEAVVEFKTKGK